MKNLGKLKLNQLSKAEMDSREMNSLRGGANCCICGCRSESPQADNYNSNIGSSYVPADGGGGAAYGSYS